MAQRLLYFFLLLILTQGCDDDYTATSNKNLDALPDSLFLELINPEGEKSDESTENRLIKRIDNLLLNNSFSAHKEAILYYEKGRLLANLEKDIEATGSLKKALSLFNSEEDKLYIAKTHRTLGNSYTFLGELDKASEHIMEALSLVRQLGNKEWEAEVLNTLAHLKFQYEDIGMAIEYLEDAINIQIELKDTAAIAQCYNNLGFVYMDFDPIESVKYFNKSIDLGKKGSVGSSFPYRNIGSYYLRINDLTKAEQYLKEGLALDIKKNYIQNQITIYSTLMELSIKKNDPEQALIYKQKADSCTELKITEENEAKLKLVEKEYRLLTKDQEIKQTQAINDKNRVIFIIALGLVLLASLLLYLRYKNNQLKLHQEKMNLEQEVLRSQMNPHFIFNALSAIQNSLLDNDPMKSASYLSKFAKLIRQNFDFVKQSSISLEEELDSLKNYMDTQKLRFSDNFDYEINVDDNIDVEKVRIPPLLIQPFIENAIEHGLRNQEEKGLLQFNIFDKTHSICYEIKDNGLGMSKKKDDGKLHAIDIFKKRLKLLNTRNEDSLEILSNERGTTIKFCLKK